MRMVTSHFKKFLALSILLISCDAEANNQWLVGFKGGAAFASLSSSSTSVFNGTAIPAPYNTDIYSINTPDQQAVLGVFGGYQWNRVSTYIPYYNVTLHYEHQFDADINGNVQQYAVPDFTNYHYSMALSSDILAVIGKVGLFRYKCMVPYFSAGAGVVFNHVNNYNESLVYLGDFARVSPGYGNNDNTNFAYTAGAGIDFICSQNFLVSAAYEYWNLGKINSGAGAGAWSGTFLNFGTLHSSAVLATITYYLK